MAIIKHISASMGYDRNDRRKHITSCAILMDFQPASITKTGEACPRASADFIPASLIAAGEACLRASAEIPASTTKTGGARLCVCAEIPVPTTKIGGACLSASAEIPAPYNATGRAATFMFGVIKDAMEQVPAATANELATTTGGNTTKNTTGMDGNAIPNTTAAEAHVAGLIAAYKLATAQGWAAISLNGLSWTAAAHVPAVTATGLVHHSADANGTELDPSTANERAASSFTRLVRTAIEHAPAAIANELVTSTAHEQVTTADGLVTDTSFTNVLPDPEEKAQGMFAAPIMGTTSAVSNDSGTSGSSGSMGHLST